MRLSEFAVGDVWFLEGPGRVVRVDEKVMVEVPNNTTKELESRPSILATATIPDIEIPGLLDTQTAAQNKRVKKALDTSGNPDGGGDDRIWKETWTERSFNPYVQSKEHGHRQNMNVLKTEVYCVDVQGRNEARDRTSPVLKHPINGKKIADPLIIAKLFPPPKQPKVKVVKEEEAA